MHKLINNSSPRVNYACRTMQSSDRNARLQFQLTTPATGKPTSMRKHANWIRRKPKQIERLRRQRRKCVRTSPSRSPVNTLLLFCAFWLHNKTAGARVRQSERDCQFVALLVQIMPKCFLLGLCVTLLAPTLDIV